MAITTTTLANPIGSSIIVATDAESSTVEQATTSSTTIYQIRIDNTLNSARAVLRLANVASNAATSSTVLHQFTAPGLSKVTYVLNTGLTLGSGLAFWVGTAATNANTTDPTEKVEVRFLVS